MWEGGGLLMEPISKLLGFITACVAFAAAMIELGALTVGFLAAIRGRSNAEDEDRQQ